MSLQHGKSTHLPQYYSYNAHDEAADEAVCLVGGMLQALCGCQVKDDTPRGVQAVHHKVHQGAPLQTCLNVSIALPPQ